MLINAKTALRSITLFLSLVCFDPSTHPTFHPTIIHPPTHTLSHPLPFFPSLNTLVPLNCILKTFVEDPTHGPEEHVPQAK